MKFIRFFVNRAPGH